MDLRAKCVVCGTRKQNKPDPAILLEGANYLGLSPNECLYVGDAITDVQASRQLVCKLSQRVMDTSQMTKHQKHGIQMAL